MKNAHVIAYRRAEAARYLRAACTPGLLPIVREACIRSSAAELHLAEFERVFTLGQLERLAVAMLRGGFELVPADRAMLVQRVARYHTSTAPLHKNANYNIVQAPGNCNPLFVVIYGQRTDSGHMAPGAEVKTIPLPRDKAIEVADRMQADYDDLEAALEAHAAATA